MVNVCKFRVAIFVISNFVIVVYGWRPYTVSIYNQSSTSRSGKVITRSTVHNGKLDLYWNLRETIPNLYMSSIFSFESADGKYDLVFLNRTVSMCKFYANKRYEPILQAMFRVMRDYGEMPSKCPVVRRVYYLQNLTVEVDRLPPMFPEKNASILATYFEKVNGVLQPLLDIQTYFGIHKTFKES